jgi:phage gp29-like protein
MTIPRWLRSILPTRSLIPYLDGRLEPPAVAHTLDAERLGSILRSAESGDMEDLFSLYRDIISGHTHAQAEFAKRKLAVLGEDAVFAPHDEKQPADATTAAAVEEQITALPNWLDIQLHLLDSTLYPLSLVEKIYRPSDRPGYLYELAELRPVPYRLLDYSDGHLMIYDVDSSGNRLATKHHPDPTRYIIHRGHPLTSLPDTWGGPMRAVTFWYLFSVMDRHWWSRFLDRYGAPFIEANYDESDDSARLILARAFQSATKLFGIAVPKSVQLKMHQAAAAGSSDAFEAFHAVANAEMSKVIVGQTLSATAASTGLGSGVADQQESVRQDIRQFDATRLAHTLRTQLFVPLCRLNAWTGRPPSISWGAESADDMAVTADILRSLPDAGLELTDDAIATLGRRLGLPLRRLPAPTRPAPGFPLAAPRPDPRRLTTRSHTTRLANDAIAASAAESYAQAMAASLSPVASILAASSSMDDFERRLRAEFPTIPSRAAAEILSATMSANAANALLNLPTPPNQ